MKKYTQKDILDFNSKIISLTYKSKHKLQNTQTGVITASTSKNILFRINTELEKPISYDKIINIEVATEKHKK